MNGALPSVIVPSVADRLEGARYKLVRAREHLDALKLELARFKERNPYDVIGEADEETGEYVIRAIVREQPNPYWGTILGDFIHNTRSALNYLTCELVLDNGGQVTNQTQFPIYEDEGRFDSGAGPKIAGMRDDAAAFIKSGQPYHGSNPSEHPLAILANLSNADKHRALSVALFFPDELLQQMQPRQGMGLVEFSDVHRGPIEDGAVIAHGRITAGLVPVFEVQVNVQMRTLILFDERWRPTRVANILDFVRDEVIEPMRRFFHS